MMKLSIDHHDLNRPQRPEGPLTKLVAPHISNAIDFAVLTLPPKEKFFAGTLRAVLEVPAAARDQRGAKVFNSLGLWNLFKQQLL